MNTRVKILGMDPGSSNFGLSVIEARIAVKTISDPKGRRQRKVASRFNFTLLHLRKVQNLYKDLKKPGILEAESLGFTGEIQEIVDRFQPNLQIAERYMSRRMGGVTIELINMMLGTLRGMALTNKLPLHVIPASSWKNEVSRRGINLVESVYVQAKQWNISDHEVDSVFIAIYGAFYRMGLKAFEVDDVPLLIRQVLRELKKFQREKPAKKRRGE